MKKLPPVRQFDGIGAGVFEGRGKAMTADDATMLAINAYALKELTPDDVAVYDLQVCSDQVDRDRERFNHDLLEDYAATLVGKSLLEAHDWGPVGIGRFIATELTPIDGQTWLTGRAYLLRADTHAAEMITKIDGGVAWAISIGYYAPKIVPVMGGADGELLYWEYTRGDNGEKGEALEASFVFLGAQYDARVVKAKMMDLARQKRAAQLALKRPTDRSRLAGWLAAAVDTFLGSADGARAVPPALPAGDKTQSEQEVRAMDELKKLLEELQAFAKGLEAKNAELAGKVTVLESQVGEQAKALAVLDEIKSGIGELKTIVEGHVAKLAALEPKVTEVIAEVEGTQEVAAKTLDRVEGLERLFAAPRGQQSDGNATVDADGKEVKAKKSVWGNRLTPADLL